jgi:hypothetical protein
LGRSGRPCREEEVAIDRGREDGDLTNYKRGSVDDDQAAIAHQLHCDNPLLLV